MGKTINVIKAYLLVTLLEGIVKGILAYVVLILIPAMILVKPPVVSTVFIYITLICIAASALRMYIISPILIALAYIYAFLNTVIALNVGILSYAWEILGFTVSFTLDVSVLIVALFAGVTVPMILSAFYSYFITSAQKTVRRPPVPLTGTTMREIISEILG